MYYEAMRAASKMSQHRRVISSPRSEVFLRIYTELLSSRSVRQYCRDQFTSVLPTLPDSLFSPHFFAFRAIEVSHLDHAAPIGNQPEHNKELSLYADHVTPGRTTRQRERQREREREREAARSSWKDHRVVTFRTVIFEIVRVTRT